MNDPIDPIAWLNEQLLVVTAERDTFKRELRDRVAAKQKAFSAFGHVAESSVCACPYCRGDVNDLSEMTAEYEMQKHAAVDEAQRQKKRAEAAEAALRAQRTEGRRANRANRFDCTECGQGIAVDEDGCCRSCGKDATPIERTEGRPPEKIIESYRVEPDSESGDWHILMFANGKQTRILTHHPLVIVEPETH